MGYLLWGVLIAVALFFFVSQFLGKQKYKDQDLSSDIGWLEKSAKMYPKDETVHRYYMGIDGNIAAQGHIVKDYGNNVIYEEKILYATATDDYEVDYINHLIDYKHHHKMSHPMTLSTNFGPEGNGFSFNINSTFRFDGEDIWKFIREKGYGYKVSIAGLGYIVEITRNGKYIGRLYSSDNGKNYHGDEGEVTPGVCLPGQYILECKNSDIDGLILIAVAFARTDINPNNFDS